MASESCAKFSSALDKFARRLYNHLSDGSSYRNLVCSPLAVQMCAGIIRMGLKDETQAANELDTGINFTSKNAIDTANDFFDIISKYQNYRDLNIVTKIYVKWGYILKQEFCDLILEKFHAHIENIDFGQRNSSSLFMNNWFDTTTRGLITNIVYPDYLGNDTDMVIINTIHLRAAWTVKFDEELTRFESFYLDDEVKHPTQIMNSVNVFYYAELPELNATALRIAYRDCKLYMLIVLPNTRTGLKLLQENLMLKPLHQITSQLKPTFVDVKLPKFTTEFEQELTPIFRNFNIKRIFDGTAEFSKVLESNEKIVVSKILHKTIIDVTEDSVDELVEDSKSIMFVRTSTPKPNPAEFYAKHPFYYAVYDADNVRLLEGNLMTPQHIDKTPARICACQSRADQMI